MALQYAFKALKQSIQVENENGKFPNEDLLQKMIFDFLLVNVTHSNSTETAQVRPTCQAPRLEHAEAGPRSYIPWTYCPASHSGGGNLGLQTTLWVSVYIQNSLPTRRRGFLWPWLWKRTVGPARRPRIVVPMPEQHTPCCQGSPTPKPIYLFYL